MISELFALKYTPWYRWHPNIAIRYLPAVEWIRRQQSTINPAKQDSAPRDNQQLTILEIGSGGLGIAPYLNMPVTGVDTEFMPPFHPLLNRVIGDVTKLKFINDSFDIVVNIDMLEHLPRQKRQQAVSEMMRVAKNYLIIGVPCGKLAMEHDRKIRSDYINRHKAGYKFADEHIKFGLPEEVDILNHIQTSARYLNKEVEIEIEGNMNLRLRSFLMWGWMSGNVIIDIIFRKVFLLLIPLFKLLDREPYYRKIFFVKIKNRKQ